ncbi:MAG: Tfp pilus assembly protein FimT/FimU [Phycisphaerae bacterium]
MIRRGLTLVEMVLVLSLTGVLAAVSVGGFVGFTDWRAATGLKRLADDIRFARQAAIIAGVRTAWVFDAARQSYELRREPDVASGAFGGAVLPHALTGGDWRVALAEIGAGPIVRVQGTTANTVVFGSDGLPRNVAGQRVGNNVVIRLIAGGRVVIERRTGVVRMEPGG